MAAKASDLFVFTKIVMSIRIFGMSDVENLLPVYAQSENNLDFKQCIVFDNVQAINFFRGAEPFCGGYRLICICLESMAIKYCHSIIEARNFYRDQWTKLKTEGTRGTLHDAE